MIYCTEMGPRKVRRRLVAGIGALACMIAFSNVLPASGQDAMTLELTGILIPGGVECQLFQAEGGGRFTLIGDLKDFKNGDRVKLTGEIVQMSHCMQDATLLLATIGAPNALHGPD